MTYKGYKYYYVTESGKDVPYPLPLDAKWKKADDAGAKALIIPVTRSRPAGTDVKDDDDRLDPSQQKAQKDNGLAEFRSGEFF